MKIIYIGSAIGFDALVKALKGKGEAEHIEASQGAVAEALEEADALLDASMKVRLTGAMLRQAKNLKIIACATTGSDHIDAEEAANRSIAVRTLSEDKDLLRDLTPAAEHSWMLLMACARKLPAAFEHVKTGSWTRELFPGIMLKDKQIGIIGCGRIGGWMGRYAQAFGMRVVGFDPYVDPLPKRFKRTDLKDLVRTSDFIGVHVSLTDETRLLLSRECFRTIRPGAVLINTSRGAVVDEAALLESLESGRLGAAGLDVLEGEPDIDRHPLVEYAREHDNVIITPHCGGFSPEAVALVCARTATKILGELGLNP
jgi:D-3-phosphoglycerate dehydrogenase